MPRRSAITKLLSFAKEDRRHVIEGTIKAHDQSAFPFHTYIVMGWAENKTLWCKIGRAKNIQTRLASFDYPNYFQQIGITTLAQIHVISWSTKDDYKAAEVYVHRCLDPFRYKFAGWAKRSEWFTSENTAFTTYDLMDEVMEVWGRLKHLGALCWWGDDGRVYTNKSDPRWLPLKVTKITAVRRQRRSLI